ncbi:DEAD/DEAH box helicase [bacterium]|nr:DEAD/DEAH box helicase [bacterium]
MLFANQVKREFSMAEIKDSSGVACQTSLQINRGTLGPTQCSCSPSSKGPSAGVRCKHVAALSIWVIRRGSLLRAGIVDSGHGVDEEIEREENDKTPAEFVGFVRGLFENKSFIGIAIEPALRYLDPSTSAIKVDPVHHLVRQTEPGLWRTVNDVYLDLVPSPGAVPILNSIDSTKVVYQGATAIDHLVRLLTVESSKKLVFQDTLKVEIDEEPMKLISLGIGKKGAKGRALTYEFRNSRARFSSDELELFSKQGRLSTNYVWKGDRIYKFDPNLSQLSKYAHRSGMSDPDDAKNEGKVDAFGFLDDNEQNPLHPIVAYRLSLELGVEAFKVDTDWREFHDWKKNFERSKISPLPKVKYGFDLREYQQNGLSWMWSLYQRGLSALLADDMGLGKTHQVLAFLSSIYRGKDRPRQATLVVAPTSVVAAWSHKLHKYPTGLRWYVFHGTNRKLPPDGEVDIILTTYGLLQREAALRDRDWHSIILDEAQAIKNATTISSRASRALKSTFRVAMTGTPVENQSVDLWSVMEFLLPGYMGSLPRFKRLYGSDREGPSEDQALALRRLIQPFLLRRTKSQVLTELPEKTEEVLACEMTAVQKKVYKAYLTGSEADKVRDELKSGKKIDYANVLALLTRLKQVCDHPELTELTSGKVKKLKKIDPMDSGKWEAFEEIVTEALGSNLKVVVFTQYLGMMDLIAEFLKKKKIGYTDLRGDTPDRGKRIERFAEDPDCHVFICSLLAGGLGIDLTAASVCVHFDRWWNPAKENQATDRLHRFGQTRGVQVFKLQIPGTIEDRIASIIQNKKKLAGALIEESPLGLKAFSREELLALLNPNLD